MDPPRERLAQLVAKRRKERQLSVSEAARLARVSRGTWIAVEKAERETEDYNYAGFERALEWEFGSIETILGGGQPTVATQPASAPPASPLPAEIRRWLAIMADPDVPDATKVRMKQQMQLWVEQIEQTEAAETEGARRQVA